RVRCQLVTVPGQPRLLHRRRYLLEKADVIVFVADSRPESFAEARDALATTVRLVEKVEGKFKVGVILQANKQDLPGALPPDQVLLALSPRADTTVLGSVASIGQGVMQTFILAARIATDRIRALLVEDETLVNTNALDETPDGIYAAMAEEDRQV